MVVRRQQVFAILGLWIIFAAICFPLILSKKSTNFSQDEESYHLPAVRQIAAHWPSLDLTADSLSATSPGYHYLLATVGQAIGTETRTLRFVNWGISALLIAVLFLHAARFLSRGDSFLVVLPLLGSNFFVKSASWVVTDNPALLFATLTLLACLQAPDDLPRLLRAGVFSAVSVAVRQMNIWTAALPLAATLDRRPPGGSFGKIARTLVLSLAPPVCVLALLVIAWKGLVPPVWHDASVRFSIAGPIYLFSVFGLFATLYAWPFLRDAFAEQRRRLGVLGAFLTGAVFSLCSPTTPDRNAGRWGGYLWNLANHFPQLGERSLLFTVLCAVGFGAAWLIWTSLRNRGALREANLFAAVCVVWPATFLVNRQVFHRYFEPTVLMLLIIFIPLLFTPKLTGVGRVILGLGALLQLGLTLYTAHAAVLL